MADHLPLAEKARAEIDSFVKLWRDRRWLAVVLAVCALGFLGWSAFENWRRGREIGRLESALRESERENRGLRETVAPLIASAAKEFPGEEINASLKKLVERMEAERPGNRPIASASATVEVTIDSPAQMSAHFLDRGGILGFAKGSNALLTASSVDSFGQTIGTNLVHYKAVLQMPADDKIVGKPLRDIAQSEYLQIELASMEENQKVIGGKAVVVFNGSIRVEFPISTQQAMGRRIFVRQVQDIMRTLLPRT